MAKKEPKAKRAKRVRRLLTQADLDVAKFFSSRDTKRENLKALHVTEAMVEATDGHVLFRLKPSTDDPLTFPDTGGRGFLKLNLLMEQHVADKLKLPKERSLASHGDACIDENAEGKKTLSVLRDDEVKTALLPETYEDNIYPDTETVFPPLDGKTIITVGIGWPILKAIVGFAEKHNRSGGCVVFKLPTDFDGRSPVHFTLRSGDTDQEGYGVLMPFRL